MTRAGRASLRGVVAAGMMGWLGAASAAAQRTQGAQGAPAAATRRLSYPAVPRLAGAAAGAPTADNLNGIRVDDPYRGLENVTSAVVKGWIAAENAVTDSYLATLPGRDAIRERVATAWVYARFTPPRFAGERRFLAGNSGMQNRATLYVDDRTAAVPRVLIDPNAMWEDGLTAMVDPVPAPDGRYAAYTVSSRGSRWLTARVRDVRTRQDLDDRIEGILAGTGPLVWTHDDHGFFYVRTEPGHTADPLALDGRQRIYYHRLGKSQSDDRLVYENTEHPEWRVRAGLSQDGQYLLITLRAGAEERNRLYVVDLDNPKRPDLRAPLVKLFDQGDALYEFVANQGPVFYLRTSRGAPRYRLVAVDINTPDPNRWSPVIRETYDPLVAVYRVDDRFVAHRLHDAHSVLELFELDGTPRGPVPLPGIGTVSHITPDADVHEFYFNFESFLQPPITYRCELDARAPVPYQDVPANDLEARYETTQIVFTSKDGTRVPMFVTARRGLTLDGTGPTLLTAIGSLNEAATPTFDPAVAAWLELGGIYAVANVRGGGGYGRAWHDAGAGQHKQTAIDDLVAAAEFLVAQRYTRPASLGLVAHDVGGLVAGAALTRRPDLFGAAAIDGGLLDMVRYARFTSGRTLVPEFGSPDLPADLRTLMAYSPLHNVRAHTAYPATFLSAGDQDGRIVPLHTYKFAAALQGANSGGTPVLLRVEQDAGDPGLPTTRQIAADVDRLTFLASALHLLLR